MPKFAPNTGFKMPGVGSKNIDSPGNFRDEQHVDKVGYCDTTEDRMLPEGSSPLKVRYASSGYLKDLDAISIPVSKKGCPKGSKLVDGKCVPDGNGNDNKGEDPVVKDPVVPVIAKDPVVAEVTPTRIDRSSDRTTTADQTNFSGGGKIENDDQRTWMTGEKGKIQKANPDYTPAQVTQAYRNKYNIGKSTTTKGTTTTVYKVNGKITDKAGYDAAGPSANKSIS
jgi:hypothetical protein